MSTNFYVRGHRDDDDPQYHIGKRSAAGYYCWDCGITLCKAGPDFVHASSPPPILHPLEGQKVQSGFYEACPKCGQLPANAAATPEKTGVQPVCSFTWAMDPELVAALRGNIGNLRCPTCSQVYRHLSDYLIEDECGELYTLSDFVEIVLGACPIHFTDSIGTWFC